VPAHADGRSLLEYSLRQVASTTSVRAASVALAVAVTAASAQFTLAVPFTAVPITLTPMAVLLTAAALGSRLGAVTQVLYVLLGAAGAAVFAPSPVLPPGVLRLVGPTGGYLLAYPMAAFATGWLAERGWDRRYLSSALAMLAGLAIIYLGGVAWLAVGYTHSIAAAVTAGLVQFVALDVVKILAAAYILPTAWRLVGRAGHARPTSGR
jgi:biotin transport system substrate-specific component